MRHQSEKISLHFANGVHNAFSVFRADNADAPVIIIFPAMGVKANYYRHYAAVLAAKGVHVVTADHRGHGHSSIHPSRGVNWGYREQVEEEYPAIVSKVEDLFPSSKIVVMGHSLGGQMGSMFVSRYEGLVDGFILNASCSVYYKGWRAGVDWGVLVFAAFCNLLGKVLGYYPGHKIGFGGKEARGIIKDWYRTAHQGIFAAHGSDYDYQKAMREMQLPVLAISYEGDTSAPPKALKNLYDKFLLARVTYRHITPAGDSSKKYNHYSWVKEPEISMDVILKWMEGI